MKKIFPYLAILAAMLIWAGSGIAIKHALTVFAPMTLIVSRFTVSVLLMLVIGLVAASPLLKLTPLRREDFGLFFFAGIFQPFLYYLLETFCYKSISSPTIAEALLSTSPLLAPVLAVVFLRERVTVYNIAGIIISTAGVLLLVLFGAADFAIGNPWGIVLAFFAVLTAVVYTVILKKIPEYYSPLSVIFYVQLVSLFFFYPLWGFTEADMVGTMVVNATREALVSAVGAVLYLAVGSSMLAYVLFCYSVRILGVTQTNAFNNARPVFTALIMLFGFGEHLPWGKWLGIVIIVCGLFICQYKRNYE